MKELIRIVSKKLFLWSFVLAVTYYIADYGESFALGYFGTSPLTLNKIIYLTIVIVICNILTLILGKIASYVDNVNNIKTQNEIKKYYFKKMQNMSMEQIHNTHTGYMTKLISNLSFYFFETIYQFEGSVIPTIIGGFSILYMICRKSIFLGIMCVIVSFIAVLTKYILIKNKQKYQKIVNEADSKYNATLIDLISNIITVRKLKIENFCNKKIDENSNNLLEATKVNEKKRSTTNFVFTGLMDVLKFALLMSTISIVAKGEDGLPYLLFYMSALGKLYYNLNDMVRFLDFYERFKTAKKQLDEYFNGNYESELVKKFNNINLRDVVFSYTKNSTKIEIPKFVLEKGDKISIMGESGQGKTTVMNILSGLYPLQKGELLIDNNLLNNSRLDLVFVSQEVDLFDLSIRDNLVLGKDISDEKILELLEEAGLTGWYNELPNGLDTMVGERGIKLSAGQKQRLNLIRGILIDKDLYFFDESTSNLDSVSEEKIINMIEKYLSDKTYVIVTHREKLKKLCNRHYEFENHIMKEKVTV